MYYLALIDTTYFLLEIIRKAELFNNSLIFQTDYIFFILYLILFLVYS